jgi:hypothetical protein
MKNLKSFTEYVNESQYDEFVNEGALAKKGAKELADINLEDQMENAEDDEWRSMYQAIADAIGDVPSNVIQVDSETNEEDPLQSKIYNYLSTHMGRAVDIDMPKGFEASMGWQVALDPKLNVVRLDDYGFVAFYFSSKSNF